MGKLAGYAMALATLATAAAAEEFSVINNQDAFMDTVVGRPLTRMGIQLEVTPTGEIQGRAFGTDVTGAWAWDNGFFCRDLYFGDRDLGPNCQQVMVSGNTVRFRSDRGTGDHADLRMR